MTKWDRLTVFKKPRNCQVLLPDRPDEPRLGLSNFQAPRGNIKGVHTVQATPGKQQATRSCTTWMLSHPTPHHFACLHTHPLHYCTTHSQCCTLCPLPPLLHLVGEIPLFLAVTCPLVGASTTTAPCSLPTPASCRCNSSPAQYRLALSAHNAPRCTTLLPGVRA